MLLDKLLKVMIEKEASDLFISANLPPSAKINGELRHLSEQKLSNEGALDLVKEALGEKHQDEFFKEFEANFAIFREGIGRFRVSAFWQRQRAGMVIRRIVTEIPTVDELKLPETLTKLIMAKRGLMLVVGGTGTGKSTSLAALIGYRNQHSRGHILTIEDPVEFVHEHGKSMVTQREVGTDTESFESALKSSLRQAPDVILVGEIRSQEVMEYALTFAETGHLCVATLHANNANQAIERIMHMVPKEKIGKLMFDLSLNLRGIVAQQLVPTSDGGRVAAFEVLLNSPIVAEKIAKNDMGEVKEIMGKSRELGMQTFDQALFDLYKARKISFEEALRHADAPNDLRLRIKLSGESGAGDEGAMKGVTVDLE
ncbi:PilT/PilU family type 4a pilus ATPase [Pseudidiomarina terrestris]|uniref:PilT/PilU family type 4a pilus ATPase n=1 Tax=Pseudidiomarina terrestris TaxID=2820060 RepID=A0AAW7QUF1_9GAMM|nr:MULTISPECIES: PilT/PilU family type 4a pilus ATPase [unclassified Pseudidiomarina]MDN7123802.1 PilT/PilU family type 4a pilus ATPase [Pseudidiomarina sp. 1APP75-32.1]MDN7127556.1 PilT/PilU family type 4a pilus ATPase [Pseudidiomarina sp. 1APR75-33.1]MDN7130302.1 PilT/PilU family type 4a pilus ATPase [Pseudidiomarina sp. 1APR75-15]MDN7136225.1 PilT/PilU family type 4a pilus ATPase [Pseudidiomarina sp. 1ASP75-5]MDN7138858.1 PilT/PilU family type 4a pilus ATPase [Pseudidiomarina sp. 1ASP75-14]